ncbi:RDD family protein [Corynebacterium accolens]|uniref:RDD family protein n=2 Tax=Corynebacteriaceae TaxID=1653 RepID=UPI002543385B|nr:RDD family protein [Corynebacterium accolens]MDK4270702.1 RDD family protein [Corynebacterium accolens]
MNADDIAPDLYEKWDLDRNGGEDELSVLLEAKDIKLGQQGYNQDEPRRVQLRIAASILGSAKKRAEYDEALRTGLRPTWGELGTLSSVGQWSPAPRPQPSFHDQPQGPAQAPGFAQPSPYSSPYARDPFAQHASPQQQMVPSPAAAPAPVQHQAQKRPSQETRIGMGILDFFLAGGISGAVGAGVDELADVEALSFVVFCIVMVVYVLGSEVWLGASPAKILAGYTVRDVDTKEKLSLSQSAKRQ